MYWVAIRVNDDMLRSLFSCDDIDIYELYTHASFCTFHSWGLVQRCACVYQIA